MSKFFESDAVSIGDLLGRPGSSYKIPLLQRKYVWGTKEIEELLQDIKDSYDNSEQYYFVGGMVFAKETGTQRLSVIDGQQRLVTLVILLSSVRDYFRKQNDDNTRYYEGLFVARRPNQSGILQCDYILELRDEDNDVFRDILDGSDHVLENTVSTRNLVSAKETIDGFVNDKVVDLYQYMWYLLNNVYVVRTIADDQSTAFTIFENLNSTGSILQPEDLLKNLLLQSMGDEDYERFGSDWENLIKKLTDKNGKYVVQVSTFLRHFINYCC